MALIRLNNQSISSVTALPSGVGGKVLQVVQTVKKDTFNTNSSSFTSITGLSVSITPSSASSKILIKTLINYGGDSNLYAHARVYRDSTSILVGDTGQPNQERSSFALNMDNGTAAAVKVYLGGIEFLDEPASTSSLTYSVHVITYSTDTIYINRPVNDENLSRTGRYTSIITATEIGA